MRRFRQISIPWKLTWTSVLASMTVLALACIAFFAHDLVAFRRELLRRLGIRAQIIGLNSAAALVFNDTRTAGEILAALRVDPHTLSATLYTPDRRPFTVYRRDPEVDPGPPAELALVSDQP